MKDWQTNMVKQLYALTKHMVDGPNRAKDAATETAKSAYSGITYPQDVLMGRASPEDPKRAMDALGLVAGGGAGRAATGEMDGVLGTFGGRPKGLTLYHGSPNTFDKFDRKSIGSGTGANVEGTGFYFTNEPYVAEKYRTVTSVPSVLVQQGRGVMADEDLTDRFLNAAGVGDWNVSAGGGLRDPDLFQGVEGFESELFANYGSEAKAMKDMVRTHRKNPVSGVYNRDVGRAYKVNVDIPPQSILDLDRPIKEYPKVMDLANDLRYRAPSMDSINGDSPTRDYAWLMGTEADQQNLNDIGFKAFKYKGWEDFAGDDYEAGRIPENYVVFNPNDIEIEQKFSTTMNPRAKLPQMEDDEAWDEYLRRLVKAIK